MIRNGVAVAALATLAIGCSDKADSGGDTAPACDNSVSLYPADGASNVYYRTSIEATFAEIEDGAEIVVNDGAVSGTSEWVGNTLVFTPDPLDPGTEYTVAANYSCGAPTATWSTASDVGTTVDTASIIGMTYELDISSGRFVEPPDVGKLLGSYLTVPIMIGVTDATDAEIQMAGAIGVEDVSPAEQDICEPTIDFPAADFVENPFFSIGPQTTTLAVAGYEITIDDLNVSGAFASDGSYIGGGVLAGRIDTRPLVPLLEEDGEDDAICEIAGSLGIPCEPCEDGGEFCLTIYVDELQMLSTPNMLEPQTEKEACARAECTCDE